VGAIRALIAATSNDLLGTRDRALVLLGFAAALRSSELVAPTVDDLIFEPEGVTLRQRRSETNQEGAEETLGGQSKPHTFGHLKTAHRSVGTSEPHA
jgi:hypothetical protein